MIYLEFCEKIKSFFKNSCDLIYALNLYVTVFFQPTYTQKQIKTMNSFENEKFRPHQFFLKKDIYFFTLRKKAINQLVLHQFYSEGHTKLLGYL